MKYYIQTSVKTRTLWKDEPGLYDTQAEAVQVAAELDLARVVIHGRDAWRSVVWATPGAVRAGPTGHTVTLSDMVTGQDLHTVKMNSRTQSRLFAFAIEHDLIITNIWDGRIYC